MITKNNENKTIEYSCNGKIITFNTPLVMGILNLTPDSFYDGGKYDNETDVLKDAEEKLRQGADILDMGAASTRPDAAEISAEEEWQRLEKPLTALRTAFPDTFISVDTYHSVVAKQSAEHGADMINDISGGNFDARMFETIATINLPYVLMHIQGTPQTMQVDPTYTDVVKEVKQELEGKIKILTQLNFQKIILDPGFGFGKNNTHNYQLLKHLSALTETGFPVLAGMSRKRMINSVIGTNPVTALNGTTVANTIALLNGASILRVHDVAEAKQAIKLVEFYENS